MKETTPDIADAVTQMPKVAPRRGGWRGAGSANSKGQSAATTERNFHNIPQRSHSIKVAGIYRAAVSNGIVGSRGFCHCAAPAARHSASARHAAAARLDLPPLASMPIQTRRCVFLYMYIHIHTYAVSGARALTFRRHAREVPPRALSPSLSLSLSLALSLCGFAGGSNESALRISGQPAGALVPLACCGSGGNGPVPDRK